MKKVQINVIKDRELFKKLSDQEKESEYFGLVDQITAILPLVNKPEKNSNNSSISPSHDLKRKHDNTHKKGEFGPPFGHTGVSRKVDANPDYKISIKLEVDPLTGEEINSESKSYHRHQILELEPVKMVVIELQRQTTTVNGRTLTAPNPEGIEDYDRIGPNLKNHIHS